MFGNIKALIVVLAIAATVFHLARPIALQFIDGEDFSRRRRVWFILTALFFVCPSFWLYTLFAVPMLLWANRHDSNPIGLYLLLLQVISPISIPIPILGNNGLFPLDNYRLLAFCVLLPAAIQHRKTQQYAAAGGARSMEVLLLAFGALEVALYVPPDLPHFAYIPDALSNVLRRAFLYLLDIYLLYFTVSRTCQSRRKLLDAAASLCLACAVMAALAMFEHARNWLLYTDVATRWTNDAATGMYLVRGGSVRAQTSAGHSIAQGFLFTVAFGLWLYLKSHIRSARSRIAVTLLLWGGLYATNSRGAWLGAGTVYFTFLAAGPRAGTRLVRGTLLALAAAGLVIVSPIGDQILDMLPQAGKPADPYRHQLAERGWAVALAHPLFGDRFPWPEMEDLRQGEGIIDIVNTYLCVALYYGLVGLFCFVAFILVGMTAVYLRTRRLARSDPDLALFGTSLVACIAGILIMIDSVSFNWGCQKMFYVVAGFTTAYTGLTKSLPQRSAAFATSRTLRD